VVSVNLSAGIVELHLHAGKTLPPGAAVKVYHNYLFGKSVASVLEVIDSRPGSASARPTGSNRDPKIAQGDEIVAWN
jgi:hypothetical protein